MRSQKNIEQEIERINHNPYEEISEVEYTSKENNEPYIKGLKYALGEDIEHNNEPSVRLLKRVSYHIKDEMDVENITIEKTGDVPIYTNITLCIHLNINSVSEYEKYKNKLDEITDDVCKEDEYVHTSIRLE